MSEFKKGDIVRLKTKRGPHLVVGHIIENTSKQYVCRFWDDLKNEFQSVGFFYEELEKVNE